MKFYTPCNNLPFQSVYRVKGGTEMDGPNRLEELVNTYETTLYRAALAILGDAHEAEDAVQDAFLRCLEKAPDFESPAHARAWLLRVTVNGCKSRLRAPWRRRTAPLLDAYPAAAPEEGTLLESPSNRTSPRAGLNSPMTVFIRVLLPAPLAPMREMISLSPTSRLTSYSAWTFP